MLTVFEHYNGWSVTVTAKSTQLKIQTENLKY